MSDVLQVRPTLAIRARAKPGRLFVPYLWKSLLSRVSVVFGSERLRVETPVHGLQTQ